MDMIKPGNLEVAGLPFISVPISVEVYTQLFFPHRKLQYRWCATSMVSTGLRLGSLRLGRTTPGGKKQGH